MKLGFKLWLDESTGRGQCLSYEELRDVALAAEEAGFDSLWVMDHLLFRMEDGTTPGIWEAWTILSALAEATKRVKLGTLVLCNQFRDPVVLAKMAITLDEVSQGRFIMGIGAGWHKPEFDVLGIPFNRRVSQLEEALQIIHPLLKKGYVDFEGQYYQARNCEMNPRASRPDSPQILVAGYKSRMLRLTAQYADLWNFNAPQKPELATEHITNLRTACTKVGRDPDTLSITVQLRVAFPEIEIAQNWMKSCLTGSNEEIVAVLKQYEQLGVSHLILQCGSYNMKSLTRLSDIIDLYSNL